MTHSLACSTASSLLNYFLEWFCFVILLIYVVYPVLDFTVRNYQAQLTSNSVWRHIHIYFCSHPTQPHITQAIFLPEVIPAPVHFYSLHCGAEETNLLVCQALHILYKLCIQPYADSMWYVAGIDQNCESTKHSPPPTDCSLLFHTSHSQTFYKSQIISLFTFSEVC